MAFAIGFKNFLFGNWIPLTTFTTGIIIGFGVPLWQSHWVDIPELSIEVTSITRHIPPAATIDYENDPELTILAPRSSIDNRDSRLIIFKDQLGRAGRVRRLQRGLVTFDELDQVITILRERLERLPDDLKDQERARDELTGLSAGTASVAGLSQINDVFPRTLENRIMFRTTIANFRNESASLETIQATLLTHYNKAIEFTKKELDDLRIKLPAAERRVIALRSEMLQTRAYFVITTALTNTGKSETSIKKPALFRVYIGTGNYVDLKLLVDDYKAAAQVPIYGTKIVSLTSPEIRTLPDEDRALINNYWQQSVYTILFIEDSFGRIHHSNRNAFAEGVSQKIIYDRLSREASSAKHLTPLK